MEFEEPELHEVEVKMPSPAIISKLRNGHRCRISKGTGLKLKLLPERINKLAKAFSKGASHTLDLTQHEIMGSGLYGSGLGGAGLKQDMRKLGKKINRQFSQPAKKAFQTIGKAVLPVLKQGGLQALDVMKQIAPQLGGEALSALAVASGQPELVPIANELGQNLGGQAGRAINKKIKQKVNLGHDNSEPNPYGDLLNQTGMNVLRAKGYTQDTGLDNFGSTLGTLASKRVLGNKMKYINQPSQDNSQEDPSMVGEGLYAGKGLYGGRGLTGKRKACGRGLAKHTDGLQANPMWATQIHNSILQR